jgi:hypothetical protein
MIRMRAEVTFDVEMEDVEAGGSRFRELAEAARQVGFELVAGKLSEGPVEDESDDDGWTRFAPLD